MMSLMKGRHGQAPSRRSTGRVLSALLFAGLFTLACKDATGPEQLTTLTLTPATSTTTPTGTVQLTSAGTRTGSPVTNLVGATYAVTSGGGTVSNTGLFTAPTTPGTSTVTVTCGGLTATATITVTAGPLTSITVTPNPTLQIGATQQFTAVGRDFWNNIVAITPVWSTTNPPGTINASTGLFTAGNTLGTYNGSVRATAASSTGATIFGTANVTVIAGPVASLVVTPETTTLTPGATQTFTAVGRDAGGNIVPVSPTWSVVNGGGTVPSGATGSTVVFTAGPTVGTYANTVRAALGTLADSSSVIVIAGPLASLVVTPETTTLAQGGTQMFTAVGRDANGNLVTINPSWSVVNGGGTVPAGSTGTTVVFTAGNTPGTFANTVRAVQGTLADSSTVIVSVGTLATLVVTPETATLDPGANQTFTAVGRDSNGNIVTINPTWQVVNGGGTIPAGSTGTTVVFTAGTTAGTFTNTVRAFQGTLADSSTVIVPAPLPATASAFRMIARVAWTCTNGSISGSVATNQTGAEVPPGSVTQTLCPISGTTEIGTAAAKQAYQDFLLAYTAREAIACGTTLTGSLAGQILAPGVYCFDNAATLTGTLTLSGPSTGVWLFKIGAAGVPGALTGTSFNVVMAGGASACNVTWWVRQASSMTDSNFQGHILAGAGISFVRGTYKGNAWSKEDVTVTGAAGTPAPMVACDGTLP